MFLHSTGKLGGTLKLIPKRHQVGEIITQIFQAFSAFLPLANYVLCKNCWS